jgi:hypothetical protein
VNGRPESKGRHPRFAYATSRFERDLPRERRPEMTFLQRILKLQAALWAMSGIALGLAPGWVLETIAGQPPVDDVWPRLVGVMAVVFALTMVLVSRRIDDVWWWSWSFALLEAGAATVFALNATFGLPEGATAWFWWAMAAASGAFCVLDLIGLARAGQEQPLVGSR